MELLECTENKITKDENGNILPHLEIIGLVLVHCNIVNNDSIVFYVFVPNNLFGKLLDILPKHFLFLKTFN